MSLADELMVLCARAEARREGAIDVEMIRTILMSEAQPQPAQVPACWQYRWTNPGDNPNVPPEETDWKPASPRAFESMEAHLNELRSYRYNGRPCYVASKLGDEVEVPEELCA